MSVDGTRIYEIRTRNQFLAALKRNNPYGLRAFVKPNMIVAWDAETLVHPDVRQATGDFGIPVHMDASNIYIRPHGFETVYIKQMYRDLRACPIIPRVYGGVMPTIRVDDEDSSLDRVDDLGWEEESEEDRDEAEGHWRDLWSSY